MSKKTSSTKHFILIDPLEKLNVSKDSSLLLGLTLKRAGASVFFSFGVSLFATGGRGDACVARLVAYEFEGTILDTYYLENIVLKDSYIFEVTSNDVIHFRYDPPFDLNYFKKIWPLLPLSNLNIINAPRGIIGNNEKMLPLSYPDFCAPTVVAQSYSDAAFYIENWQDSETLVAKPLELFQGMGVQKISRNNLAAYFANHPAPAIIQPYLPEVELGETRAIYFMGKFLGAILKIPPKGNFLANIAQGAKFQKMSLSKIQKQRCDIIVQDLSKQGITWIAFDLIGDIISEVNFTCPGLLVECSHAAGSNLAQQMIREFS